MTLHTLRGPRGMEARVADLGGILVSLRVPDREGRLDEVILGHEDPAAYDRNPDYLGALIGRSAGRIAHGRFTLDGRTVQLDRNAAGHHLHGGRSGFHAVVWSVTPFDGPDGVGLTLHHTSAAGDGGYPGRLDVTVRYTLTARGALVLSYRATTDAATPVNLTHHAYFNLAGRGAGDVLGHTLAIGAARFAAVDAEMIPTGELRDVVGTPFDFRAPTSLGLRIAEEDDQLRIARGYDHTFALDPAPPGGDGLRRAATLYDPESGRLLEVHTTEPGLQLYTGNGLSGEFAPRSGVALETQHFPDAPNHPHFPSTILRPGATLRSQTVYAFMTR